MDDLEVAVQPPLLIEGELSQQELEALQAVVQAEQERIESEQIAALQALSGEIESMRRDAVEARISCGIEEDWLEDEEFYEGIDDANRAEEMGRRRTRKPVQGDGSGSRSNEVSNRSTVFLNITRPYVDAAAARVGDMLLPTDDKAFAIEPTPIPQLQEMVGNQTPIDVGGQQVPATDLIETYLMMAREKARKAERRIDDWVTEAGWHAEVRQVIDDCARLGSGVLKGPVPVKKRKTSWQQDANGNALIVTESWEPGVKAISPWNFFPSGGCGQNIHRGGYVFERDFITTKTLSDLKGGPGYIDKQIDKVLEAGPGRHSRDGEPYWQRDEAAEKEQFEIWYFQGTLKREQLERAGFQGNANDLVPVVIEMINGEVIKIARNPLDKGSFTYDVMVWQARYGLPWGRGVSRQIRTPQRGVNAAARALMDNAGLSSGAQIVYSDLLVPVDGSYRLAPLKGWKLKSGGDIREAEKAMSAITIPSMQVELLNIVNFYMKMAEDVTGLPMLLQGQQGKAPETVGGMTMLANNAAGVLRRIAKLFDDRLTEPCISRFYEWLMQYGPEDDEKGDYCIRARGSSALVERDIQNQQIVQLVALSKDPAYGLSPARTMEEFLKSQRFDPKRFQLSDEEKRAAQQQPPPKDPRVEVAEINAQKDLQVAQINAQSRLQAGNEELKVRRELELAKFAEERGLTLEKTRAQLLKIINDNRLKRDLFVAERAVKQEFGSGL